MKTGSSMEIMQTMRKLVDYLADRRKVLADQVRRQVLAMSLLEYRKAMEIATKKLKADKQPATLIKDLARGMCAESEAKYEQAQLEYKANLVLMETAGKELNALQSMNKVVESI